MQKLCFRLDMRTFTLVNKSLTYTYGYNIVLVIAFKNEFYPTFLKEKFCLEFDKMEV